MGTAIVQTPGYVGGRPRIEGTRMPVSTIVTWSQAGYDAHAIATQVFPHLSLAQIESALAYYEDHRHQIDCEMRESAELLERLAAGADE
jgi:uncharacterized protein (DUF433 family)